MISVGHTNVLKHTHMRHTQPILVHVVVYAGTCDRLTLHHPTSKEMATEHSNQLAQNSAFKIYFIAFFGFDFHFFNVEISLVHLCSKI